MTSHPGSQTITIHILPNISGSKGNQTMKFDQVIEYQETRMAFKLYPEKNNIFRKFSG